MTTKPVRVLTPVPGPADATAGHADPNNLFINPYSFVPTPNRERLQGGPLGDEASVSQAAAQPECYSGVIPIEITTRTPLLLPDLPRSSEPRGEGQSGVPRTFGMRQDANGGPLLNGSAVKGMLRSAYEAITNSRLGVVDPDQNLPGAIRSEAAEALEMYPAVVLPPDDDGDDRLEVVLELRHRHMASLEPLPAAWLPIELGESFARHIGVAPDRLDTMEVEAWLHLQSRPDPNGNPYYIWRASDIGLPDKLGDQWREPPAGHRATTRDVDPIKVSGIVHWTSAKFPANGNTKHDERLVVTSVLDGPGLVETEILKIWPRQRREWQGTIQSYVRAHKDGVPAGHRMGTYVTDPDRWDWRPGRTLHAKLDRTLIPHEVLELSPAMIGRVPFPAAPNDLIRPGHLPAGSLDELSPADRVFGWVRQDEGAAAERGTAVGGLVAVGAPRVVSEPPSGTVERLAGPKRIGTLSGPKPSQYRFYAGDTTQWPLDPDERRANLGYVFRGRRLRGRKFYLPHVETFGSESYWDPAATTATTELNGKRRYREYLGAGKPRPRVDLATREWIKPGVTFRVELRVTNLSAAEIGALLWLLALPDACSFGLGLGKPLGFGAVRVEAVWDEVRVRTGAGIKARYLSLDADGGALAVADLQELVTEFDRLIVVSSHQDLSELMRVRDTFLAASRGYVGVPVHYPRPRPASAKGSRTRPEPQGELFKWWVANEKSGAYLSLPAIGPDLRPDEVRDGKRGAPLDPTLPYLDEYVSERRPRRP